MAYGAPDSNMSDRPAIARWGGDCLAQESCGQTMLATTRNVARGALKGKATSQTKCRTIKWSQNEDQCFHFLKGNSFQGGNVDNRKEDKIKIEDDFK